LFFLFLHFGFPSQQFLQLSEDDVFVGELAGCDRLKSSISLSWLLLLPLLSKLLSILPPDNDPIGILLPIILLLNPLLIELLPHLLLHPLLVLREQEPLNLPIGNIGQGLLLIEVLPGSLHRFHLDNTLNFVGPVGMDALDALHLDLDLVGLLIDDLVWDVQVQA
jgi:hypothetical protein